MMEQAKNVGCDIQMEQWENTYMDERTKIHTGTML